MERVKNALQVGGKEPSRSSGFRSMDGKYIYGIIRTNDDNGVLDISGLGRSNPVYLKGYKDLGCVLSEYSGIEFSSMPKEEILRCLLTHQTVVEHVMKKHTVLPVKFGTILAAADEVQQLLAQGHTQFVEALAWFQDKMELEVAATWDIKQVLKEIGNIGEISQLKKTIASMPQQRTLEQRIRLGQMVKVSLDQRRDSYREQMISFLKPMAVDAQSNTLISDELVMNVAFLVEKASLEEFNSRLGELNDLFHNQINFRIIGPLPPYSFATVEVIRLNQLKIEEARQLLLLDKAFSEPDVRKAYRRLAAEAHTDCNVGDTLAKTKFIKLHQASELLTSYCRGQAESGNNLLINIKCPKVEEVQHLHFAEIEG